MSTPSIATEQRRLVVFGASGQLGSTLAREAKKFYREVTAASWSDPSPALSGPATDIVFAGGLVDPGLPAEQLWQANVELPQRVIREARSQSEHRYLTLGTVLEAFPEVGKKNRYIDSKIYLSKWMSELAGAPGKSGRVLHVRLHTIYGGPPKPHMFLGQIARALANGDSFSMSSGRQLREYHHAHDVGLSLLEILRRPWGPAPVTELNSGAPVRLDDLARKIFAAFGREDALKVGDLLTPAGENLERVFARSPAWMLPRARDPVEGVIGWLKQHLQIS